MTKYINSAKQAPELFTSDPDPTFQIIPDQDPAPDPKLKLGSLKHKSK